MAVVQISKIQQRRGQKLLNGMPQLAAAELAWAVDTQELFIGNGSVTEGAPYVGNTRVLTEHDNLLALAGSYKFAETDASITGSIFRSIQSKLDEIEVSIIDFGPNPASTVDHSEYFNLAFTQLFQNSNTKYRKKLKLPNGHYYFSTVLRIPSNIVIEGETKDGVILDVGTTGIEFLTANNLDSLDFSSTNRPENVRISNLTIQYESGQTNITGLKDSYFENVKWQSSYVLGDTVSTPVLASQSYDLSAITASGNISILGTGRTLTDPYVWSSDRVTTIAAIVADLNIDVAFVASGFEASRVAESLVITALEASGITEAADIETYFAIQMTATGTSTPFDVTPTPTQSSTGINNTTSALSWTNLDIGTRVNNISFIDCEFDSVALAVKCIHTNRASEVFGSRLVFRNCDFFNADTGVYIEGISDIQENDWKFFDCKFEEIAKQALFSTQGTSTVLENCEFKTVGNGVNTAAYPETEIVKFGTPNGNIVHNCKSNRHQSAGITRLDTTVGIPEVLNGSSVTFINNYYTTIDISETFTPLAAFSSFHRYIIIDYVLTLSENKYVRKGQIVISNQSDNQGPSDDHVAIADNYTYTPSLVSDPGGTMITNFEFSFELADNDNNTGDSTQSVDTIILTYKNPLQYDSTGTISYSIRYGV